MNKLIYVCSPYRGDIETNTKNAREYCRRIVAEGNIPIAPHLLFTQFMDDNIDAERERAMEMNLEIMRHSDEVRVFGRPDKHRYVARDESSGGTGNPCGAGGK